MSAAERQQQLIRDEAAGYLGRPLTDSEWSHALPRAEHKLRWIIGREGDANGTRLQPWYLGKLVEEAVNQEAFSQYTFMRSMTIEAQRQIAGNPICTACSGCQEIKKAVPLRNDPTTKALYHRDKRFVNPGQETIMRRMTNEIIKTKA